MTGQALVVAGDGFPAKCSRMNENGDLPTCTQEPDGSWHATYPDDGMPGDGAFAALFVLGLLVAIGTTVWKVSTARRMARDAGMDEGDATQMALFTDEGLEATYLASSLRQPPADPEAVSPPPRDSAVRLRELESLRSQGLVTEEEYAERRRAILDSL